MALISAGGARLDVDGRGTRLEVKVAAVFLLLKRRGGIVTASKPVPSDLDIAQAATPKPIIEIAESIGINPDELIPYGLTKAKVHLDILKRVGKNKRGKYVDVTAITPTPLGEGKTTTTVGLVQGLGALGHKAIAAIRQPSMGPDLWHQGRGRRWWLQPGHSDGRVQSAPDG